MPLILILWKYGTMRKVKDIEIETEKQIVHSLLNSIPTATQSYINITLH